MPDPWQSASGWWLAVAADKALDKVTLIVDWDPSGTQSGAEVRTIDLTGLEVNVLIAQLRQAQRRPPPG